MPETDSIERSLLRDRNIYIIFMVTLFAIMGVSSITPAFPRIVDHFQINYTQVGLLITVFTLPGIIFTPFLGVFADRYGRKTILFPALLLFGLAGGACYFSPDFNTLLLFRFLQGTGAASLGALNLTLLGDLYTGHRRTTAMGYNSSVLSVGTAGYPAIGGALALVGWNYPFLLPLLGVPLGFILLFGLKNSKVNNQQHIGEYLKNAAKSMRNTRIIALFLLNVLTFIVLYGAFLTFLPKLMEDHFASSSFVIGLIMTGSSIFTALTSFQLGRLIRWFGSKRLLLISYGFYVISLVLIPFMPGPWYLLIPAVFFGMAQGTNIPNIQNLLVSFAPMHYRAAFMSVNGMILRLGQTLGPLLAGFFFILGGIVGVFFGGAFVVLIMVIVVLTTLEH